MKKRALIGTALLTMSAMTWAQGFGNTKDETGSYITKRRQEAAVLLGRNFWIHYGKDECKHSYPELMASADVLDRKKFSSPSPVRVEIQDMVTSHGIDYYRVLIDDTHTAYLSTLMRLWIDDKDRRECSTFLSPTELAERKAAALVQQGKARIERDIAIANTKAAEAKNTADREAQNKIDEAAREAQQKMPGARIGMTPKQVIEKTSWGKPESINRTTNSSGTHEQWVYGGGDYLYFFNGRLQSIQN